MRSTFFFVLFLLPLLSLAGFEDHFTEKGLRLDYYHSGYGGEEWIQMSKLSEVPYFAGNRINLVDTFWYGSYRISVRNAAGTEIYAKGYSTLFNEWRSTSQADSIGRTFKETIVIPFPREKINICFLYRQKDHSWDTLLCLPVDPASMYINKEALPTAEVTMLSFNGQMDEKLDLVFLPEGYTKGERDKFHQDCLRFRSYLLNCEPFKTRQNDINIRAVWVASQDTGTDNPGANHWANTAFSSSFYTFGSERYLTIQDQWQVMDYACSAPCDQVVMMVNAEKYGGGGVYNFFTVATTDNANSDFLLVHEFGHGFAGLGDEYYTSDVAVEDYYPSGIEPWEPNLTTLVDFDRKWKDMLAPDTPVPTPMEKSGSPIPGVYEGGGYVSKGVYRPVPECTMKSVRYDDFCPVCKRAINRMIDWETAK